MLQGHTLVLNRSWVPVHVTSVRRALALMYLGHARAVHPDNYSLHDFDDWCTIAEQGILETQRFARAPHFSVPLPDVVVLTAFNGFIRHECRFSRQGVFERDGSQCQYCAKHHSRGNLTLDHVVPASRGGGESWDNLVVACHKCNVKKANRTPDEAAMPLIRRPKKPAWAPHFGGRVAREQISVWSRFVDGSNSQYNLELAS